jgi:hypothetical protein
MASLYDITGEKFVTPLASKNRKIYIDAILFLHKVINELFETQDNDKARIVDILKEHLNDMVSIQIYSDDTGEEIDNDDDNNVKTALLINKLEDYGWLSEESIGNGKKALDFNSHSYSFIALIEELMENRKP